MPNMPNITPTINEIPLLVRRVALAEEIINSSYYLSVSDGNDGEMLDDYDISAVEEVHMQCASTYGW